MPDRLGSPRDPLAFTSADALPAAAGPVLPAPADAAPSAIPPRFEISGFAAGGAIETDDPYTAAHWADRGIRVTDRRTGAPGGLDDPDLFNRWRIEVPAGRPRHGESFADENGVEFFNGVAYVNLPDALIPYRIRRYTIIDRGPRQSVAPIRIGQEGASGPRSNYTHDQED